MEVERETTESGPDLLPPAGRLMTKERAARYLGISVSHLEKLHSSGLCSGVQLGRRLYWKSGWLDSYYDRLQQPAK